MPEVDATRPASMHGERAAAVRPSTLLIGGIIAFLVGCGAPTLAPNAPSTVENPPAGVITPADLPPIPADCPVTRRVVRTSADPDVDGFPALGWYRNAERTLWAGLAPAYRGDQWYAGPTEQKVRWWHRGRLVITGRRLDGPAPQLHIGLDGVPQGTPSPGATVGPPPTWTPLGGSATGILIPVAGCWELTARTPWDELRFVIYAYPPALRGSP